MLNHVFDKDDSARLVAQNQYNIDSKETSWVATYRDEFAKNLARYDGIDGKCGDSFATDAGASNTTAIARYATLADLYADDRLWLNVGAVHHSILYFDLEHYEVEGTDHPAGGRRNGAIEDVVDQTYSLTTVGLGESAHGFADGIVNDSAAFPGNRPFPFFVPPLQ